MTNPTADAAKLLPNCTCGGRVTLQHYVGCPMGEALRLQLAPPAGEPDFAAVLREHWLNGPSVACNHADKVANCYCSTWQSEPMPSVGAAVDAWVAHVIDRLGLAARPKVEDALGVDLQRVKDISHLIIERDAAREALAEREAELAKAQLHLAQSDYTHYVRTLPDAAVVTETNWLDYEKDAVLRHRNRVRRNRGEPEIATDAARQQQKASAKKDKPAAKGDDNG